MAPHTPNGAIRGQLVAGMVHMQPRGARSAGLPSSTSSGHPRAAVPISADRPAQTSPDVDLEQRRQAWQVDIELDSLRPNAPKGAPIVTLRRRLEERRRAPATASRFRPDKELPAAPADEIDRVRCSSDLHAPSLFEESALACLAVVEAHARRGGAVVRNPPTRQQIVSSRGWVANVGGTLRPVPGNARDLAILSSMQTRERDSRALLRSSQFQVGEMALMRFASIQFRERTPTPLFGQV